MINRSKVVLSGNLRAIKNDFKTGAIYLKTVSKPNLSSDWNFSEYKEGYKVILTNNQSKADLLSSIEAKELIIFEELEPTLKEIFLAKVGEE